MTDCLAAATDDWDLACIAKDARFSAIFAVDMDSGEVKWTFLGSGAEVYEMACGDIPRAWNALARQYVGDVPGVRYCPPPGDFLDWSFATGSPNIFKIGDREVVGIGEKSGIYWVFDAVSGEVVWSQLVGPYSEPGGVTWGAASDGARIFVTLTNADHVPYPLVSGETATGGFWTAMDASTGEIIWQTATLNDGLPYSPPVLANGVLMVSSQDTGAADQMFALSAETGEVLWQFSAGGPVRSHPAVADGAVFWGYGVGNSPTKFYALSVGGQ